MKRQAKKSFSAFLISFCAVLLLLAGCSSDSDSGSGSEESSSHEITFVDESGKVLGTQKVSGSYSVYFNYSKEGYKCTFFDSKGLEVKSGQFSTQKDCKITVKTAPVTYRVKFAKSANLYGTCSGTLPDDMTCSYDLEYTMPENNLTYVYLSTTYKSAGWTATDSSTKVSSRGEYAGGTSFKNLAKKDGEVVTLYACFTNSDGYSLKFYTSGTSGSYTTVYADAGLVPSNSIPAPENKSGYSFKGWYLSTDSSQTAIDFSTYKITGDASFYAKFTADTYKITFVTAHGKAPEAVTYTYSSSGYLRLTDSAYMLSDETGYIFSGWCIGDSTSTSVIFNYSTAKDVTLSAKWTPWTATIKFDENSTSTHPISGGYQMSNQTVNWGEETALNSVTFYSTDGWAFAGWNEKADGSGSSSWQDKGKFTWKGSKNNETITLYAQWKKSQFPLSVKLSAPKENEDIKLTYDSSSGLFTAQLSGATKFEWYIDGNKISGQISSRLSASVFTEGIHSLMVTAEVDGNLYSETRAVVVSSGE